MEYSEESSSWGQIDQVLQETYNNKEPNDLFLMSDSHYSGGDSLQQVKAYWSDAPVPHWHYISYGFSSYRPASDTGDGLGFELTFRLKTIEPNEPVPYWPVELMEEIARYLFRSGSVFRNGHYLDMNGPITRQQDTSLVSLAFIADPLIQPENTESADLEFLQMVALAADELVALKCWSTHKFLHAIESAMPGFVTDIGRKSLLEEGGLASLVQDGIDADGSSTNYIFVDSLEVTTSKKMFSSAQYKVTLSRYQLDEIIKLIKARLPFYRDFGLIGEQHKVWFSHDAINHVDAVDNGIKIGMDSTTLAELLDYLKDSPDTVSLEHFAGLCIELVD